MLLVVGRMLFTASSTPLFISRIIAFLIATIVVCADRVALLFQRTEEEQDSELFTHLDRQAAGQAPNFPNGPLNSIGSDPSQSGSSGRGNRCSDLVRVRALNITRGNRSDYVVVRLSRLHGRVRVGSGCDQRGIQLGVWAAGSRRAIYVVTGYRGSTGGPIQCDGVRDRLNACS